MSVKKRKTSKGEVWSIDVRWTFADGRRERVRLDSPMNTRRGAEQFEREVMQSLMDGTFKSPKAKDDEQRLAREEQDRKRKEAEDKEALAQAELAKVKTFRQFADEFTRNYTEVENKPSEKENKRKWLANNLIPYFGDMPMKDIGVKECDAFKALLREEEYAIHSVNNCLAVLKKMLSKALEWNEIEKMPKIKNLKRGEEKPPFFLTEEQAKALVAKIDDSVLKAMVIFALHTGLRVGELRALHWADIDFKSRRMVVRRNLWKGQIGSPKSGRGREVPLANEAIKALQSLPRPLDAQQPVFCNPDGSYLEHNQSYSRLRTAAKRAGIKHPEEGKGIGFHMLRHTFASHLAMKGVPQKAIKELLGHASLDMTDKYMHLSPNFKDDSVAVLDGVFGVAS